MKRPTAAARTICMFCQRPGCQGACTVATSRALTDDAVHVALAHAVARVRDLVVGLGILPGVAVRHVARQMHLNEKSIAVRLDGLRRSPSWSGWCLQRPTHRPSRELEVE